MGVDVVLLFWWPHGVEILPYLPAFCEFLGCELVLVMSCLLPASACSISNGQDCYVN